MATGDGKMTRYNNNRRKLFRCWRPNLFLFLLLTFDLLFMITGAGNGASSCQGKRRSYKCPCKTNSDCRQDFRCDPTSKQCECQNIGDLVRLSFFYNRMADTCVSAVGKICTLPYKFADDPSNFLPKFDCVPYASCVRHKKSKLPDIFGTCKCENGAKETAEQLCSPPSAVGGGEDEGFPKSDFHSISRNQNDDIEKPKATLLNNWKHFDPTIETVAAAAGKGPLLIIKAGRNKDGLAKNVAFYLFPSAFLLHLFF